MDEMRLVFKVLLSGLVLASFAASCMTHGSSTGPLIIYARRGDKGFEIRRQELLSRRSRVIYKTPETHDGEFVPEFLGFLPSPDGKWILVWDYNYSKSEKLDCTHWLAIRLSDGKTVEMGKTDGQPWLLPYWADNRHVVLEGEGVEAASFDVRTGKLSVPLPRFRPKAPDSYETGDQLRKRLIDYCHGHYTREWETWRSTMTKLEKPLNLDEYLKGFPWSPTREYVLLRSVGIAGVSPRGIPNLGWLQPYDVRGLISRVPYLACSPDGRFLAFARTWDCPIKVTDPRDPSKTVDVTTAGYQVEVFEASTGERVWSGAKIPARPRQLPEHSASERYGLELPWSSPYIRHIRWSRDGRYLSFTTYGDLPDGAITTRVVDSFSWQEVVCLRNAENAFIIPAPN